MTKQELSQLYHLNKEIEGLRKQLNDLKFILDENINNTTIDQVKGSAIEFPYVLHTITLEGLTGGDLNKQMQLKSEIADIIKLIEINQEKCIYEYNRLNRYITSVENSQMRQILTYRYMNALTWKQVAFNIGEYDESYVRRKHDKFLSESEKLKRAENVGFKCS